MLGFGTYFYYEGDNLGFIIEGKENKEEGNRCRYLKFKGVILWSGRVVQSEDFGLADRYRKI